MLLSLNWLGIELKKKSIIVHNDHCVFICIKKDATLHVNNIYVVKKMWQWNRKLIREIQAHMGIASIHSQQPEQELLARLNDIFPVLSEKKTLSSS